VSGWEETMWQSEWAEIKKERMKIKGGKKERIINTIYTGLIVSRFFSQMLQRFWSPFVYVKTRM
jgi:hypothetical protein